MEITSSTLALSSSHAALTEQRVRETLRVQLPDPPRAPRADTASISSTASSSRDSPTDDLPASREELELVLLQRLLEQLTGRKLDLDAIRRLRRTGQRAALAQSDGAAAQPSPRRFGLVYDRVEQQVEQEATTFSAAGSVRTADGREIQFTVSLSLSRSFVEEQRVHLEAGDTRAAKDPIVLNFGGGSVDIGDTRFSFDLDADGRDEQVPLVGSGSGLLALDRNGNGAVDDGRELFGPQSGNGFAELRALDQDGNGWLDASDEAFSRLRIWSPGADGGTLSTLAERGVGAISVRPIETPFEVKDAANALVAKLRGTTVYVSEDGEAGTVQQVDLTA
jgi:hypothetical protein